MTVTLEVTRCQHSVSIQPKGAFTLRAERSDEARSGAFEKRLGVHINSGEERSGGEVSHDITRRSIRWDLQIFISKILSRACVHPNLHSLTSNLQCVSLKSGQKQKS